MEARVMCHECGHVPVFPIDWAGLDWCIFCLLDYQRARIQERPEKAWMLCGNCKHEQVEDHVCCRYCSAELHADRQPQTTGE